MNREFRLDTSHFPEELKLLLWLLNEENESDITERVKQKLPNINWNEFLKLTRHHRVYPLIYLKLKEIEQGLIYPSILQALHSDYIRNTFQMLHLSGEMERVCRAFNENGICSIMLKGPVLAEYLYGDISLRTSKDLDILVSTDDIEKTEEILFRLGYEIKSDFPRILSDWKWREHHINYFHPQNKIEIELHWRLELGSGHEPLFHHLWERKSRSSLTSEPIYFLGEEDLFLYLTSHGARHAWFRLRWLVDIDRLVRKEPKWEEVCSLQKKHRHIHTGEQALILASQLLRTPLKPYVKTFSFRKRSYQLAQQSIDFIENMVDDLFAKPPKHIKDRLNHYSSLLMPPSQKCKYFISRFYPSSYDAELLMLPRALYFIYFPLRPFLWFWRLMKQRIQA